MHRIDISLAYFHSKLEEYHINTCLFCTIGRIHNHQIYRSIDGNLSKFVIFDISQDKIIISSLYFLLQQLSCALDIIFIYLKPNDKAIQWIHCYFAYRYIHPHISIPVPTPISATVQFYIGQLLQIWNRSLDAISGGVICCYKFIFYFYPYLKSSISCRKSSMCFCFNFPFILFNTDIIQILIIFPTNIISEQKIMLLKLASGSYDGTIKFWDPRTGTNYQNQQIKLAQYNLIPNRIQISDTKLKLIAGMCNTCKLYDLNKPNVIERSWEMFKGNVTALGFRGRDCIYTGCEDGIIRIFDLRKKGPVKQLKQTKPINCAVMHPNDIQILSGDEGGDFRIWDIVSGKARVSILSDNQVGIRSISVSQNGENIVFADSRGLIQPYYMEKGQHVSKCKSVQAHDDYILKIQISPNGKYIATCSADKKIKLFKINDPQKMQLKDQQKEQKFEITQYKQLKGHLKWVWDCRFSCDSAYLISCSTDTTLKLWGVEKGQLIKNLKGHQKGVICIALNDIAEG